jgi:hypothetical protein
VPLVEFALAVDTKLLSPPELHQVTLGTVNLGQFFTHNSSMWVFGKVHIGAAVAPIYILEIASNERTWDGQYPIMGDLTRLVVSFVV